MASGSCGTRDKLNPCAARPGNPTCSSGRRYLPKRDRFILVGFIWGNVAFQRRSALTCHIEIDDVFGSMRQILDLPGTQGFCDNKPAGRTLGHMRCGRPIEILPHTSEIKASQTPPHFGSAGKNWKPLTRQSFLTTKLQVSRGLKYRCGQRFCLFPRTSVIWAHNASPQADSSS